VIGRGRSAAQLRWPHRGDVGGHGSRQVDATQCSTSCDTPGPPPALHPTRAGSENDCRGAWVSVAWRLRPLCHRGGCDASSRRTVYAARAITPTCCRKWNVGRRRMRPPSPWIASACPRSMERRSARVFRRLRFEGIERRDEHGVLLGLHHLDVPPPRSGRIAEPARFSATEGIPVPETTSVTLTAERSQPAPCLPSRCPHRPPPRGRSAAASQARPACRRRAGSRAPAAPRAQACRQLLGTSSPGVRSPQTLIATHPAQTSRRYREHRCRPLSPPLRSRRGAPPRLRSSGRLHAGQSADARGGGPHLGSQGSLTPLATAQYGACSRLDPHPVLVRP